MQTLVIEALQNGARRDWAAAVAPVCQRAEGLFDRFERPNLLIDISNLGRGSRADICSDSAGSRS